MIQGNYGVLVSGLNSNLSCLRFAVGNLNFNGACQVTGYLTTSISGAVTTQDATRGTYKQNSDGSFTISLTSSTGSTSSTALAETFAVGYSPIAHISNLTAREISPQHLSIITITQAVLEIRSTPEPML